ncbi:hypothetical protein LX36DRAFT_650426 [Colletotrichum falcatum]|nr:hypothetical protein LX36DRAFT_650426 [Colletotrichum falcatum]
MHVILSTRLCSTSSISSLQSFALLLIQPIYAAVAMLSRGLVKQSAKASGCLRSIREIPGNRPRVTKQRPDPYLRMPRPTVIYCRLRFPGSRGLCCRTCHGRLAHLPSYFLSVVYRLNHRASDSNRIGSTSTFPQNHAALFPSPHRHTQPSLNTGIPRHL